MAWDKYTNVTDAATWLKRKVELIFEKDRLIRKKAATGAAYYVKVKRGGIFDCELGYANIGGEKNKTRPVLILSNNALNKGNTVVVVPLSTKYPVDASGKALFQNHYILYKSQYPFLDKDSAVKFEDIRSVDVVRLRQLRGNITKLDMKQMLKNLKFTMGY